MGFNMRLSSIFSIIVLSVSATTAYAEKANNSILIQGIIPKSITFKNGESVIHPFTVIKNEDSMQSLALTQSGSIVNTKRYPVNYSLSYQDCKGNKYTLRSGIPTPIQLGGANPIACKNHSGTLTVKVLSASQGIYIPHLTISASLL